MGYLWLKDGKNTVQDGIDKKVWEKVDSGSERQSDEIRDLESETR